jgi:hypothetical protein
VKAAVDDIYIYAIGAVGDALVVPALPCPVIEPAMSFYSNVPHRVPSPNPNPAPSLPSMYRSASPIPSPAVQPAPLGVAPGQIAPGTITYTTSYDPNGTLIYHPFR